MMLFHALTFHVFADISSAGRSKYLFPPFVNCKAPSECLEMRATCFSCWVHSCSAQRRRPALTDALWRLSFGKTSLFIESLKRRSSADVPASWRGVRCVEWVQTRALFFPVERLCSDECAEALLCGEQLQLCHKMCFSRLRSAVLQTCMWTCVQTRGSLNVRINHTWIPSIPIKHHVWKMWKPPYLMMLGSNSTAHLLCLHLYFGGSTLHIQLFCCL